MDTSMIAMIMVCLKSVADGVVEQSDGVSMQLEELFYLCIIFTHLAYYFSNAF